MNNRAVTRKLKNPPSIVSFYSTAGKKEGEGPLRDYFDTVLSDDTLGEKSWEKSESKMLRDTAMGAIEKSGFSEKEIDLIFAGDLINQCTGTNYAMRDFDIPFYGLYGACSTMTESISLASMLISSGMAKNALCITSSHFCTAEKQFRFPLEYGGQRAPTSQWTATASGAVILSDKGDGPYVTHVTPGKIIDMGVTDINNMGAAMAPAAVDTLFRHFKETGFTPDDYDIIMTGDLGIIGSDILCDLMNKNGYDIYSVHRDAGKMLFDIKKQDVHSGGSGCGCCASVLCGYVLKEFKKGNIKNALIMATGALMNTLTVQQGESIPAIAHAIRISDSL